MGRHKDGDNSERDMKTTMLGGASRMGMTVKIEEREKIVGRVSSDAMVLKRPFRSSNPARVDEMDLTLSIYQSWDRSCSR